MKKTILGTITFLVLSSVQTFANGRDGGNGGDILVCENEHSILLDKYEAEERGWGIDLKSEAVEGKVEEFLKRFTKIDPVRAEVLKVYLSELLEDFRKLDLSKNQELNNLTTTDQELEDIDDSIHLAIPQGCQKRQLVIQQLKFSKISKFKTRYVFNRLLLAKLDFENLAMTILHEALFRLHIKEGANDSRYTRTLNGFISSKADVGLGAYLGLIEDAMAAGFINESDEKDIRSIYTILNSSLKDKLREFYANSSYLKYNPHATESLTGKRWLILQDGKVEFLVKGWNADYRHMVYSNDGKLISSLLYYKAALGVSASADYNYVLTSNWGTNHALLKYLNGEIEVSYGDSILIYKDANNKNVKICSSKFWKVILNNEKVISKKPGCVMLNGQTITSYTLGNHFEFPDLNKFRKHDFDN
jgi:hypothetical protein